MSYKIIVTKHFDKGIKRLIKKFPSLKMEYSNLISQVHSKPDTGIFIGNNCYKIRLAIGSKGKGKSGGARIITYLYIEGEIVFLLSIYDKSEKSDLKDGELKEIVKGLNFDF